MTVAVHKSVLPGKIHNCQCNQIRTLVITSERILIEEYGVYGTNYPCFHYQYHLP